MSKEIFHSTKIRIREQEKTKGLNQIVSTIATQLRTQSKVFAVEMVLSEAEREYINGKLFHNHNISVKFIRNKGEKITNIIAEKNAHKQFRNQKRRSRN